MGSRVKKRVKFENSQIDSYYSDNRSWESHVKELDFKPLGLEEQIGVTADYIRQALKL